MVDQPVQLPNSFSFPAYGKRMYFMHRPGGGWQLTTHLDPGIAITEFDQLTPQLRNDYLTFHRMMDNMKNVPQPKIVQQEVIQIRDEHIRLIEAIRSDPWLPKYHRGKVPGLNELEGAKINVTKYLHWTPAQISRYRTLCRHERLAVQGVVYKTRIGEEERGRYIDDLACVFPEEWGRHKNEGSANKECQDLADGDGQCREEGFDLKQTFEDSLKYFFPGSTPEQTSTTTSEIDENQKDQFIRSDQYYQRSTTMDEIACNTLPVNQYSRFNHSFELPERSRKALQIKNPETPQTPKSPLTSAEIADAQTISLRQERWGHGNYAETTNMSDENGWKGCS